MALHDEIKQVAHDQLILQFSSSTAFTSHIIRTICRSRFSHVDMVLPGEGLLGASGPDKYATWTDPGGVQIRPFEPWPYESRVQIAIPTRKAAAIIARWRTQIGKPFDNAALHAMISWNPTFSRDWRELAQWFCSEGVAWACEAEGLWQYPLAIANDKVDPNDLMLLINPFLSPEDVSALFNA